MFFKRRDKHPGIYTQYPEVCYTYDVFIGDYYNAYVGIYIKMQERVGVFLFLSLLISLM